MTARRERERKKEKTEKERSILGGKSCTHLGFQGGEADDSPVVAEHPGPSVGWSPSRVCRGDPGQERRSPPLPWGSGPFPCISAKKMMGGGNKGALFRLLQHQGICQKNPGWLSRNHPNSPQAPAAILCPASSQDRQGEAALPTPPCGHWTGKMRMSSTKHRPSLCDPSGKEKPTLGSPFLSDRDLQNHSSSI